MTKPAPGWEDRSDARVAKRKREDAARRRVRTTSGSTPLSRARRKLRGGRGRKKRGGLPAFRLGGPVVMTWSAISCTLAIVALLTQALTWIVLAAVSIGVTAAVSRVEAKRAGGVPVRPSKIATKPGSPGTARSRQPSGSPGTPTKRRPTSGSGTRVCSEACKRSPKPKSTCKCRAPECQHGSAVGS